MVGPSRGGSTLEVPEDLPATVQGRVPEALTPALKGSQAPYFDSSLQGLISTLA